MNFKLFQASVTATVDNGEQTAPWTDTWVNCEHLKTLFLHLSLFAKNQA